MLRIMVNNKIFVGPRSLSATEIIEQRSKHLRSEWVIQKDDERTSRERKIRRVRQGHRHGMTTALKGRPVFSEILFADGNELGRKFHSDDLAEKDTPPPGGALSPSRNPYR